MMLKKAVVLVLVVLLCSFASAEEESCSGFWGRVSCILWGDPALRENLAGGAVEKTYKSGWICSGQTCTCVGNKCETGSREVFGKGSSIKVPEGTSDPSFLNFYTINNKEIVASGGWSCKGESCTCNSDFCFFSEGGNGMERGGVIVNPKQDPSKVSILDVTPFLGDIVSKPVLKESTSQQKTYTVTLNNGQTIDIQASSESEAKSKADKAVTSLPGYVAGTQGITSITAKLKTAVADPADVKLSATYPSVPTVKSGETVYQKDDIYIKEEGSGYKIWKEGRWMDYPSYSSEILNKDKEGGSLIQVSAIVPQPISVTAPATKKSKPTQAAINKAATEWNKEKSPFYSDLTDFLKEEGNKKYLTDNKIDIDKLKEGDAKEVKKLQKLLGAKQDGKFGKETLGAFKKKA